MIEGLNTGENEKKDESVLESKREEIAKMFLGENYKKLADIGAENLAKDIGESFDSTKRMKTYTLEMNDIYINEKEGIAAVLLEPRSWGGSGGIDWSKDLGIQMKDLRSSLHIDNVRDRFNKEDDMPEFWYSKIQEVKYEDNCFKVQFKGDEKIWKLEPGKKYFVKKVKGEPWSPIQVHKSDFNSSSFSTDEKGFSVGELRVKPN